MICVKSVVPFRFIAAGKPILATISRMDDLSSVSSEANSILVTEDAVLDDRATGTQRVLVSESSDERKGHLGEHNAEMPELWRPFRILDFSL